MTEKIKTASAVVSLRTGVASDDLTFLADLAHWMQASAYVSGRRRDGEYLIRERIASGTLDGALWLLGVTTLAPVTHTTRPTPSVDAVACERSFAAELRDRYSQSDQEWLYLGGVVDALDFALGVRASFWWVPLPESTRIGPPARDIYGREVL